MLTFINNTPLPTPADGVYRDIGAPLADGDELRFGGDEDQYHDYERFRFLVEIPRTQTQRPRGPPGPEAPSPPPSPPPSEAGEGPQPQYLNQGAKPTPGDRGTTPTQPHTGQRANNNTPKATSNPTQSLGGHTYILDAPSTHSYTAFHELQRLAESTAISPAGYGKTNGYTTYDRTAAQEARRRHDAQYQPTRRRMHADTEVHDNDTCDDSIPSDDEYAKEINDHDIPPSGGT
jgi:hypothetical protein